MAKLKAVSGLPPISAPPQRRFAKIGDEIYSPRNAGPGESYRGQHVGGTRIVANSFLDVHKGAPQDRNTVPIDRKVAARVMLVLGESVIHR